jgi:hypothetical protein
MTCLLYLALLSVGGDPPPAPAAMVLTVKGDARLERGEEKPQSVWAMLLLRTGDRVRVPGGGEVTLVLLGDGRQQRIKAGATVKVAAKGCEPVTAVERVKGPQLSPTNLSRLHEMARSSRGGVGVLRGDPTVRPQLLTPMHGTVILGDRPTFSWPSVSWAEGYRVQLLSGVEGRDERVLWRAATKEPRVPYPEKEKPLVAGRKYRWRVYAFKGEDKEEVVVSSKFSTLTKEEAEALAGMKALAAGESQADLLLAAAVYESYVVYEEALKRYERLAEMAPMQPGFQVALASYYERAGRPDRAKAARERAKKLGATFPEP